MTPARQRILIIGLIVLGILFAGYFGMRSLFAFRKFRGQPPPPLSAVESLPVETDPDLIRDWMTIPFISRMYDVAPNLLFDAIEITPDDNKEKSIEQLNEEYYPENPGYILETVKAAIFANQATKEPPNTPAANHPPIQPIGPIPP